MQIVKSVDNEYVKVGDIVTYSLEITNDNGVVINDVILSDTLAAELKFVPGSVWVGTQILPAANIITGIKIGTLQIGESKKITFKARVLSDTVTPLSNAVLGVYTYIDTNGIKRQGSDVSNEAKFNIVNPYVKIFKQATSSFVMPEEELTYIVELKNDGDLDVQNIIFRDDLPEQVELIQGTFKINGTVVNQVEINKGINVGNLAVGAKVNITYTVKLVDADCKGWMNNQVYIKFNYELPDGTVGEVMTTSEEPGSSVQTRISALVIDKSPYDIAVSVGDIIEYTLDVANLGEEALNDVIISDRLDAELDFVPQSVKVEAQTWEDANMITGINIGTLPASGIKTIQFKAKVLSNCHTPIINVAEGIYKYRTEEGMIKKSCSESNEAKIEVSYPHLKMHKVADTDFASLGDEVIYTVTIDNDGDVDAYNVVFKDELPKEVVVVRGSFSIDGRTVNEVELGKGINVGDIPIKGHMVITYKVKVISTNCKGWMENKAYVIFNYELVDGSLGEATTVGREKEGFVTIMLAIANFKQFSIESYLRIPDEKPNIETINNLTGSIDILSFHVIKTPKIVSIEGQKLTGYKLIVRGALQLSVEYTALDEKQSVHSAHYAVPFSTFIILPEDYKVGNRLEVEGIVEDIYYKALNIRDFFVNTTALVNVKIVGC